MPYPARPIPFDPRDFATHQSLQRVAAYGKGGDATWRQVAIDYVASAHGFSKEQTKTLLYDGGLNQPGRNIRGDVRIGPQAFEQDEAWLSGVVFHELVHSPQYAYYSARGVPQIDPRRSETERLMIALDEYEAYWWSLRRAAELGLSSQQQAEIRRRAEFALIDLDDRKVNDLARQQQFDGARDELIRRFKVAPARSQSAVPKRKCAGCAI